MRLFTGIEPDEGVRSETARILDQLRTSVDSATPRARLTWVAPPQLHLTVRFIGEVDDVIGARVIGALRESLPISPFRLTFDRLGAFPPKGPPRVLWLGVGDGRDSAIHVESAISERLTRIGVPPAERPYTPHLTLARVREPAGLRAAALFEGISPPRGETLVGAITLFQSKLSPKGPAYTVLERTPLRGS